MKLLPRWIEKFLKLICPSELFEQIEGDLIELYNYDRKMVGERKARLWFTIRALRFLRPGILLRNRLLVTSNMIHVLFFHVKFARRAFLKEKLFSLLNVLGLAVGISVSIIVLLILKNDLTYDQHFTKHDRIYRLGAHYQIPGTSEFIGTTARELGPILIETYPEIESMVRIHREGRMLVKAIDDGGDRAFYEDGVVKTDSAYFELFDHHFIFGSPLNCLSHPRSVVITKATSRKYFNEADPLEKILLINDQPYKVAGVIDDVPENTHLKFDFLLSGLEELRPTWDHTMKDGKPISLVFWNPDVYTYLLLPENYDTHQFDKRFEGIYTRYYKEIGDQSGGNVSSVLQPLTNIHFSGFDDNEPKGNATYLLAFSAVALMIVLLACINYMNLSTAKAIGRASEIAVRKVTGCNKFTLVLSLLAESMITAVISLGIAIAVVYVVLNTSYFSGLTGKHLTFDLFLTKDLLMGTIGITLVIGLLSGLYPAFYLTAIPTISAIKGKYKNKQSAHRFRRILVTVQFILSFFVVACTLYMRDQINFIMEKDMGFDKKNIVVVPIYDASFKKNLAAFTNDLLENPNIEAVTASHSTMGMEIGGNVMLGETSGGMQEQGGILALFVGDNFLHTMGIKLIRGRDFQRGQGIDEDGVYIVNESAAKLMGWGDDALGKKLSFWGGANPGQVIGVVKDFNAYSLHQHVPAMVIVKGHWDTGLIQIRLSGNRMSDAITFVQQQWVKHAPQRPFEYFFLDHKFNEQYKEDVAQNRLLYALSNICIFISLLGVFGLSSFSASQRTKEIGVRKVFGAKMSQIIFLLSKDTLALVVIASLITGPLCWWVLTSWMENFAYRNELSPLLYLIITFVALVFVATTILVHSYKTAKRNPVISLRNE